MFGENENYTIKIHTKKLMTSVRGKSNASLLCGCSVSLFTRYTAYDNQTTIPLRAVMILMEDSGDYGLLHYMAAYHGFKLQKNTEKSSAEVKGFLELTASIQKETSEAITMAMEAISDGKITYAERMKLEKELTEANGVINQMLEQISTINIENGK
jgi:hypothetical protein